MKRRANHAIAELPRRQAEVELTIGIRYLVEDRPGPETTLIGREQRMLRARENSLGERSSISEFRKYRSRGFRNGSDADECLGHYL